MFISTDFIEETGTPPGLIFLHLEIFLPESEKFLSWKNIHTFDEVMT